MKKSPVLDRCVLGYAPLVGRWHDWTGMRIRLTPSAPGRESDAPGMLEALTQAWTERAAGEGSAGAAPTPVLIEVGDIDWAQALLELRLPPWAGLALPPALDRLRAARADGGWFAARAATWEQVADGSRECFSDLIVDAGAFLAAGTRAGHDTWVDGVSTLLEVDAVLDRGAKGVIGWPCEARPSAGRDIRAEVPVVVDLMNRVERQEPLANLERSLKTDPTLVYRLLRYINSAALGLKVEVSALRQALMLLGYLPLLRWLSRMLLDAAAKESASRPLVHLSVCRAFVLERLGQVSGQADEAPEMFLCGMFSLLHLLLQRPLAELTSTLPIPERVRSSLLEPDGPYSLHLRWIEAAESGPASGIRAVLGSMGLAPGLANLALLQGLAAARSLDV